ncbi:hypothetical protein G7A66_13350 [Altererythrobacter sp. SALINAS58]|uniref:hypothetical protein n=1 Tax=Alteripontixanthobacter muriae TaxID=2705546 RepID=UPI001576A4BC|nr:hypothetical protein [Alteripontixanthobacter muriae]NTZ44046.1 hypothetical protein [Alteripontixanthobacter muriae]
MARIRAEKEATLREVLAEVSLLDVGRLLKSTLLTLGCLGIFYAIIFGVGAVASNATGFTVSDLGIPGGVFWIFVAWVFVFGATSDRSFHEWNASWFFPKLEWFSSLLLAAYIVGFIYLNIHIFSMELGAERALAAVTFWLGYAGPFLLFFSAINIGHAKLLEKRAQVTANE